MEYTITGIDLANVIDEIYAEVRLANANMADVEKLNHEACKECERKINYYKGKVYGYTHAANIIKASL